MHCYITCKFMPSVATPFVKIEVNTFQKLHRCCTWHVTVQHPMFNNGKHIPEAAGTDVAQHCYITRKLYRSLQHPNGKHISEAVRTELYRCTMHGYITRNILCYNGKHLPEVTGTCVSLCCTMHCYITRNILCNILCNNGEHIPGAGVTLHSTYLRTSVKQHQTVLQEFPTQGH